MISTPAPAVSVIIPAYNDTEQLIRCLEALEKQDYVGPRETIVVDNGPVFLLEGLRQRFPDVRFDWEPRAGSYNARNKALTLAWGDVLAFTDSDCVPHPTWLTAGVGALLADERNGMVGGRVRVVPMHRSPPTTAELYEMATSFPQHRYLAESQYAATANVITSRAVMDKVGPFNGALRSGGDVDWGQRCARAGFKQVYSPDAQVDHPARTEQELLRKLRRTMAGARDREPSWVDCGRVVFLFLIPPRKRIIAVMGDPTLSLAKRLRVAWYCVWINWINSYYRLK